MKADQVRLNIDWRVFAAALAMLFTLDAAEIGLHIAHSLARRDHLDGWITHRVFNMTREFGLGECLEYGKSLLAAWAVLLCARRSDQPIFYTLSFVNVWMAADNAFRIHETAGELLKGVLAHARSFGFVDPRHLGEVIYLLLFGATVATLLTIALDRSHRDVFQTGLLLGLAVVSPGITGVFVDAFHELTFAQALSNGMLTLAEDGGETVMLSVSCALSIGCLARQRRRTQPAHGAAGSA